MGSNWPGSGPSQSAAEILPPENRAYQGDPGIPGPRSSRGSRWASAPATYTLVGINCAVYLAMVLHGVSPNQPARGDLILFGANSIQKVLGDGEWWRLLSAAFVHIGFLHLATNMWCLWNLGLLGEPLLGPVGLIAVYVLTGVAGNLLSTAVNASDLDMIGAGASGAVFGLAGVLILLLKAKLLPVAPDEVRRLRKSVIYFAVLNFVIGGTTLFFPNSIRIDNMAHLGGFLCGLAMGAPLVPRIGTAKSEFGLRSWATYGCMTVLLLAFAYGLSKFRP